MFLLGLFPRSHQFTRNLGESSGSVFPAQGWEQAGADTEASINWLHSDFHRWTSKGIFCLAQEGILPCPVSSRDWLTYQCPCYMGHWQMLLQVPSLTSSCSARLAWPAWKCCCWVGTRSVCHPTIHKAWCQALR